MMKQYPVVEMDISELEENELNPRVIRPANFTALRNSLGRYGNVSTIVYNKLTKRVVSGNQRLKVLRAAGETKTMVTVGEWDEEEEIALMLEMNNQFSQGDWRVDLAIEQIERLRERIPDAYDALNLVNLKRELDSRKPAKGGEDEANLIQEMEIMPFEHWDYIVLVFSDIRDFLAASEWFGLKKSAYTAPTGKKKIGLGRVLDGKKFLAKVRGESS